MDVVQHIQIEINFSASIIKKLDDEIFIYSIEESRNS